nr:helicase-related protein [Gilliamella apicola]
MNNNNKKVIIFTAFADTASYLFDHVSQYVKNHFSLHTAMITGSVEGRSTVPKLHCDLNTVLTCFSPKSKDKHLLMPNDTHEIDILIATDCISEGQNLQDCDYLINYDIHWNPVRIIQRFGRIDRIGSKNQSIQLVNFWPDVTLDEYIDLKAKVETRMKIVDMTATGDDNILSEEEKSDLAYRKAQLKRLQDEVVDIEDITNSISIMDLGLNEFRLDLLEYIKNHPELDKTPYGLHAVVPASPDIPAGVIYILKNRANSININNQNRLHPFYMVYVANNSEVICDHLSPKQLLDKIRLLCKGKTEPIAKLYQQFNKITADGSNMTHFSQRLGDAINSIIEVKKHSDIDNFLSGNSVSFVTDSIKGLDDFELICFLVVSESENKVA